MFTLSAFADEISPDPQVQLDILKTCGVRYIEFRSIHKTNVLNLNDQQIAEFKVILDKSGFKVSAIGSPIGKVRVERSAGTTPHSRATATATIAVNRSTRQSGIALIQRGASVAVRMMRMTMQLNASPATDPRSASSRLSVKSCRKMRFARPSTCSRVATPTIASADSARASSGIASPGSVAGVLQSPVLASTSDATRQWSC